MRLVDVPSQREAFVLMTAITDGASIGLGLCLRYVVSFVAWVARVCTLLGVHLWLFMDVGDLFVFPVHQVVIYKGARVFQDEKNGVCFRSGWRLQGRGCALVFEAVRNCSYQTMLPPERLFIS
jgi:hypothetical protein